MRPQKKKSRKTHKMGMKERGKLTNQELRKGQV